MPDAGEIEGVHSAQRGIKRPVCRTRAMVKPEGKTSSNLKSVAVSSDKIALTS
jgi:hypothetical protein